jgi:hypothetical protein
MELALEVRPHNSRRKCVRFSGSAALAATCFNLVLGSVFHQADIIRAS